MNRTNGKTKLYMCDSPAALKTTTESPAKASSTVADAGDSVADAVTVAVE